jgi:quercetin dioxygenase-like cupin family protein
VEHDERIMDLLNATEFSRQGAVKKDLMKTAGSNIVLVCLESGQVIPPHPEPYAVVFVVLQGEGIITSGSIEYPVKPLHLVSVGMDENWGGSGATSGWSSLVSAMTYEEMRNL